VYARAALIAALLTLALVPAPAAQIIAEPCPAQSEVVAPGACAYSDGRVYLPAGADRFVREHELGHVFDAQRLDAGERRKLKRILGLPVSAAWAAPGSYEGGSERFADAYAACRLQMDPDGRWESSYDYTPTRAAFRQVCATISRAAD
jgi:hypothetical protein